MYQKFSEEGKKQKRKYGHKRYKEKSLKKKEKCQYYREHSENLSEDQKQELVDCRRNYYIMHKL